MLYRVKMVVLKEFLGKWGGIVFGALYGLILRFLFNISFKDNFSFTDLFSVTFIWIVPVIIGITPMLFATRIQLQSWRYRISRPVLTVFLFFAFCFATRAEDLICILILSVPFLVGAAVGGYVFAEIISNYRKKNGIMYSILFIPFLAGMLEEQFKTPSGVYQIHTSVIVNAPAETIWKNIVRVQKIKDIEYRKGFFNYAGIPSPLYAELNRDTLGANRLGHFEGGLLFNETVTHWEKNRKVSFDIEVIPSSIRQTVFDQHVLKGKHFAFIDATYELQAVDQHTTRLTLSSSYQLDTNINLYASFWGNYLLTDFQERLLAVIKRRCDKKKALE